MQDTIDSAMHDDTEVLLTWADVLADKSLQDLPYKIELTEDGKILMSPASNKHGLIQGRLSTELNARGGIAINGCAIQTTKGVRVADVGWMSDARLAQHGLPDPLQVAPEICVEIKSPSNTRAEMALKTALYFEAGAEEVWIVDLEGNRTVHRKP